MGIAAHVRWIRRLLREIRPDVVHGHWLCGFACFAALAGAEPLVAQAWGSDVFRAGRRQRLANRIALRRSAIALGDSQDLIDRLVALGAQPDACVLVRWGVDLETFRPADEAERAGLRRKLGLAAGPVILSPRSLMPIYNPQIVAAAWAEIAAEDAEAQLVVKHMGVVRHALGLLPFADRVRVVGHVEYEEMAAYYRVADVCLSIASSDSAPRSVHEAMACGAPCVLSDLPWVREEIVPDRHALVVRIDAGAVAGAIRRLLAPDGPAATISAQARLLVEDFHDRTSHMDHLAETYRGLLA